MRSEWPNYGCGVGLRTEHYEYVTKYWPKMDWFEVISENFMDSEGRPIHILEQVRQRYPVAIHGVSLSIGSIDDLNKEYLRKLKALVERIDPFIVSDHLCWTGVDGENLHDLLPLPFTEEALQHVVRRVDEVQNFLGRKILLENVSSYITYKHSTMPEWVFLAEVAKRSGCGVLLDLNNVFVNAYNHRFETSDYLKGISREFIGQIHLAGFSDMGSYYFDTHGAPVVERVWELYEDAMSRYGQVNTLVEWDQDLPSFPRLCEEVVRAKKIYDKTKSSPQPKRDSALV